MLGHWRGLHNRQFFIIFFKNLKKTYFVEVNRTIYIFFVKIQTPEKVLVLSPPLPKSLLTKKRPKLGIQLRNAGNDNQSCHILTVLFNRIDLLRIPKDNLYCSTLFYTNVSISTSLRLCALSKFYLVASKLITR